MMIFSSTPVVNVDAATWIKTGSSTTFDTKKTVKTVTKKYRTSYTAKTSWTSMTAEEKETYKKKTKGTKVVPTTTTIYKTVPKKYSKVYKVNFGTSKKKKIKKTKKTTNSKYFNVTATQYNFKSKKKRTVTYKTKIYTIKYSVYNKTYSTSGKVLTEDTDYTNFKKKSENSIIANATSDYTYSLTKSWVKKTISKNAYKAYINFYGSKCKIDKAFCKAHYASGMFLNSTYGIVLRDKKQKHGVFYHEFGHFVDWLCGSISETHEWHELFWE